MKLNIVLIVSGTFFRLGGQVTMDWEKQLQREIEEAQRQRTYLIAGQPFDRIVYGDETDYWGANQVNLYDD